MENYLIETGFMQVVRFSLTTSSIFSHSDLIGLESIFYF